MITPIIVSHKLSDDSLPECGFCGTHTDIPLGCASVIVLIEYGVLVSDEWLKEAWENGCCVFNIHRGDPEVWRGASVLNNQILAGVDTVHVTLMELRPGDEPDCGPIIAKCPVRIKGMPLPEVVEVCRLVYNDLVQCAVDHYMKIAYEKRKYGIMYRRRRPEDSDISTISLLDKAKIMAADPEDYPAYFDLDGQRYYIKIFNREVLPDEP